MEGDYVKLMISRFWNYRMIVDMGIRSIIAGDGASATLFVVRPSAKQQT